MVKNIQEIVRNEINNILCEFWFPSNYNGMSDTITLYHDTDDIALDDIIDSGVMDASSGHQHGETHGMNWFSVKYTGNFGKTTFSIDIPKLLFDKHIFNFMNNNDVVTYDSINVYDYNFKIIKLEGITEEQLHNVYEMKKGDIWEVIAFFRKYKEMDLTSISFCKFLEQEFGTELLKNEGIIEENKLNEHQWNFHHGKNHNGKPYYSENKYICYHETGQFGSGTYFSSFNTDFEKRDDMDKYVKNSNNKNPEFIQVGDNVYRVDFDLYKNLYRVWSEKQGNVLHTMMGDLNRFYHKVSGFDLGHYNKQNADFNNARLYQGIYTNAIALGLKCPSYLKLTRMAQEHAMAGKSKPQSFSTVFMEMNGFNGVNVSGIGMFDNSKHGSVIYDLSKTSDELTPMGKVNLFHTENGYWTNTYANPSDSFLDYGNEAKVKSLNGEFFGLGFKELNPKEQLRVLKNLIDKGKIPSAKELKWYVKDEWLLKRFFGLLYNGNVDKDNVFDYDMMEFIIKNKQYQFLNLTPDEYSYGYRNRSFFIEFLDDYKDSNWNVTRDDLEKYLQFIMSKMNRDLTDSEKEYIEEYYYDNELNEGSNGHSKGNGLDFRKLYKILRKNGFEIIRYDSDHAYFSDASGKRKFPLSMPYVNRMIWRRIVKENGINVNV